MQFDPRFLELPGVVKLATFPSVPTRPTAEVELRFDERMDAVICTVHESKHTDNPMHNTIARVRGGNLEICYPKYDPATQKSTPVWYDWNKPSHYASEEEAICWMVLLASDVGCPGQARADFPQARPSSLWATLLHEMKTLHAVASVMLT